MVVFGVSSHNDTCTWSLNDTWKLLTTPYVL